jgi:gluconate kinase
MIIIIMGVSGSGKTTIAKSLAERIKWPFFDGDNFRSSKKIASQFSILEEPTGNLTFGAAPHPEQIVKKIIAWLWPEGTLRTYSQNKPLP